MKINVKNQPAALLGQEPVPENRRLEHDQQNLIHRQQQQLERQINFIQNLPQPYDNDGFRSYVHPHHVKKIGSTFSQEQERRQKSEQEVEEERRKGEESQKQADEAQTQLRIKEEKENQEREKALIINIAK